MESEKKLTITLRKLVVSVTPYDASGSIRFVLPKPICDKYKKAGIKFDESPFVFRETDKGFLMMPLTEYLRDKGVQGVPFGQLSGLSLTEIGERINRIAERNEA
jgi:hypothetical protein